MKAPVHLAAALEVGSVVRFVCDASEAPILWMLADGTGGIRSDQEQFTTNADSATCEQCKAAFRLLLEGELA